MFEKEYLRLKTILCIVLLLILSFSFHNYLAQKNGISFQEGQTLAIANTSEDLEKSPYNSAIYNTAIMQSNIVEQPYFISMYYIGHYVLDYALHPDNCELLLHNAESYSTGTFISNRYYTNLLCVNLDNTFHYKTVMKNCINSQRPPIYYMLLHTISSMFGYIHWFRMGFFINAIFFILSCFTLLSIGKWYFHSHWVGFTGALLYALSLGCFSGSICSNPYIMTSFFILFLLSQHLASLRQEHSNQFLWGVIVFINILGNLTDYCYCLFGVAICVSYCIALKILNRTNEILPYIGIQLLSLVFTSFIYPASILHLGTMLIKGFYYLVYDFELFLYYVRCISNLTILEGQLFMHTGVIIFLFLAVFIVMTIFFKKGSLMEHIKNFCNRMATGDMADLFVPFVLVLYFFEICFFYTEDYYFVLLTLIPLISILVTYLSYRLCYTTLHSEFNSGIFGVAFTFVLCFTSIVTSTPDYLYADNKTYITFAAEHANEYCIFLSSPTLIPAEHILELEKYGHSLVLRTDHLKSIKKSKALKKQDHVIVYLSQEHYNDGTIEKLAKYGNFNITAQLTHYKDEHNRYVYIYQLSKVN